MASVLPPAPKYAPNLPKATIEKGLVSIAQVEAVVYAGEAHEQMLTLTISENRAKELGTTAGAALRRGFFIGDGTGVGKGREIAAIILDNLRRGRKKHVWVSEKQGLFKDAKRDLRGIGGPDDALFQHSSTKADGAIKAKDGVLFTTYRCCAARLRRKMTGAGHKGNRTKEEKDARALRFNRAIAITRGLKEGDHVRVRFGFRGEGSVRDYDAKIIRRGPEWENKRLIPIADVMVTTPGQDQGEVIPNIGLDFHNTAMLHGLEAPRQKRNGRQPARPAWSRSPSGLGLTSTA